MHKSTKTILNNVLMARQILKVLLDKGNDKGNFKLGETSFEPLA